MKKYTLWFGLIFILVLTACDAALQNTPTPTPAPTLPPPTPTVERVIKLATLDWPPYVGQEQPEYGFTAAIVIEAFQRAGYQVTVDFMPWARVVQDTQAGKYDAAFPEYYSDERAQEFLMSEPFADGPLGFYKRKADNITYTNLQDLKQYHIGVVLGYINTPEFDAADYLQKETVNSDEQNLQKLALGRVDLIVIDKYVAQYLINTSMPENADQLEFMEPPLLNQPLYVIFSRQIADSVQRRQEFNAALKSMQEDGTLDKILERFGFKK